MGKVPQLCCKLRNYPPLRIVDRLPGGAAGLADLQSLMGGTLKPEEEGGDAELRLWDGVCPGLRLNTVTGGMVREVPLPETREERVRLWRSAWLMAAAVRVLRGEQVMLLHGCLLQTAGGGLFLCGQSGMGKTTTARRWQAAGGESPADDMILLEYGGKELYAHPLPTWSRCFSEASEYFPFETAVPVQALLALSRADRHESVRAVEPFRFLTAVYASCVLFNLPLLRRMTPVHREQMIAAMKGCAGRLGDIFPPRMLFADLRGDLKQTLAEVIAPLELKRGEKP